jgi:3-methyladenine DNA glycosylase/8-oxoguanine DNA glycosylase
VPAAGDPVGGSAELSGGRGGAPRGAAWQRGRAPPRLRGIGGSARPARARGVTGRGAPAAPGSLAVLEVDIRPPGLYRLPSPGRDGVVRRGPSGALERLLHVDDEPALARAWTVSGAVRLRVEAPTRAAAELAVERMRFALGLGHDLRPFHRRFARHPLLGPVIHRRPWLRPWRTPAPFQALAWAICEQLIESGRAATIERRLVWRYGRASPCGRLRDAPSAAELAARAPAELEACGLSGARAIALRQAARLAAGRRLDLEHRHEIAWSRLRAISGIGRWTCEKLAFHGQGRDDQLPAGDLAYVKLVGRLAGLGRRATEDEVRQFFAPFGEYAGLAGIYMLRAGSAVARGHPSARALNARAPGRAGARW